MTQHSIYSGINTVQQDEEESFEPRVLFNNEVVAAATRGGQRTRAGVGTDGRFQPVQS